MKNESIPFYRKYLAEELARRVEENPRYSLRSYARNLGVGSGALSLILSGVRSPSTKLAERFFGVLEMSEAERSRFLVSLLEEKKSLGKKRVSRKLRQEVGLLRSSAAAVTELDRDRFRVISDWYHLALWEMIERKDFQPKLGWIAKRLAITQIEAKLALDRLAESGLIEKVDGNWRKSTEKLQTKDLSKSSSAHRKRQAQVLGKAIESIQAVAYERRHFSGITVNIEPGRIPEMRERVQKILWDLAADLSGDSPTVVYEVALQIFPLEKTEEKP